MFRHSLVENILRLFLKGGESMKYVAPKAVRVAIPAALACELALF